MAYSVKTRGSQAVGQPSAESERKSGTQARIAREMSNPWSLRFEQEQDFPGRRPEAGSPTVSSGRHVVQVLCKQAGKQFVASEP